MKATPKPSGGEAAYVGKYSLEQGGTDAAGGVNLLLFPGGDYAIAYFGGMLQGTWQTTADGQLELREWPTDPADFMLFGRHNPELGGDVELHFQGFQDSYAKIGLLATSEGPKTTALHPAFNSDANCYASNYSIRRPATQLKSLQLAAYEETKNLNEYERIRFSKKLLYSFPIEATYNEYQVIYRAEASKPAADYVGGFIQDTLVLFPAATGPSYGMPGDYYSSQSDIAATDLEEFPAYLEAVRQPLPEQLTIRSTTDDAEVTYQRVTGTSEPLEESAVKLLEPLFIARC